MPRPNCSAFSVFPSVSVARRVLVSAARQRRRDKHTPRSHRGNKGHISGQKGYWFFEAFMEQKQSDESPRETLAISQKNVRQIRCSMNIRQ